MDLLQKKYVLRPNFVQVCTLNNKSIICSFMKQGISVTLALIVVGIIMSALVINSDKTPVRTPWVEEWSQDFQTHATFSQTWSFGHLYYSWKAQAMRLQFERAAYSPCSTFGGYISQCDYLSFNKSLYVYFPSKQICSRYQLTHFPSPSQTVTDFYYVYNTVLNNTQYYTWISYSHYGHYLYTTTDKKQTTYWEYNYHHIGYDPYLTEQYKYDLNSYSENIDKKVFELPSYCENIPISQNLSQQQQQSLGKFFKLKYTKNLNKVV